MPRYQKGKPPGPGRPAGCRNKATAWFDELGRQGTEAVIRKVTAQAQGGDMRAASILLARTWASGRGRPVVLDLPSVDTAGGLVKAHAGVVAALSAGEITPQEAAAIAKVLEYQRRAIETDDHERRIQELEERRKQDDPRPGQSPAGGRGQRPADPGPGAFEDMVRGAAAEIQQERRAAVRPPAKAATRPAADPASPPTDPASRPLASRRAAPRPPEPSPPESSPPEASAAPLGRVPHWTEEYCQWRQRTAQDDADDAEDCDDDELDDPLGLYRD